VLAVVALLSSALAGANCKSKDAPAPLGGSAPKTEAARPPDEGLTEAEASKLLPGVDTSDLSPKQRQELNELANDSFCPCASMTVAGCLRDKPTCKPAARMLQLAKKLIANGTAGPMALVRVETYYASFSKERRKDVAAQGPTLGPADAKVSIVEFSDFQCPACRAAHPSLEELVKKYAGGVRWTFRHFPLPQHEHAAKAAQCAAWADEQGKFWPLSHAFFAHQEELDDAGLERLAKGVGLDGAAMLKAVANDPKYAAKVDADKAAGSELQIGGTPSVFINGRQFVGLPPTLEMLSWTVEDEFDWIAGGGAWVAAQ
jgi:protein-disulfide isomerase